MRVEAQTVFYLTDAAEATPDFLQELEYGLSDLFQAFCREHFTFEDPLDYPGLRLVAVRTPQELDAALFGAHASRRILSEAGCRCSLLLLDDELVWRPRFAHAIDVRPIPTWFLTYFPASPKVLITRPGHATRHRPGRRWSRKPSSGLANPMRHRERLGHLFAAFWLPRFWDALRQ